MRIKILFILSALCAPLYSMPLDEAAFRVGKNFYDRKLYTEAEKRFLDIVKRYPDSKHFHQSLFYLGNSYAQLGNHKHALQYYKLLLTKSKSIREKQSALLGISKSWLQMGVHDKAGDFYSFFAAEYPESEHAAAALYYAGISRERGDDIPAAIEKYRAVLDDYPNSKYYAQAIEKVAVLQHSTPESLWTVPAVVQTPVQEDFWDFEDTGFKAQSVPQSAPVQHSIHQPVPQAVSQTMPVQQYQPVPHTVVTQFIDVAPAPIAPAVVTQYIPQQVITQYITPPVVTQVVVQTADDTVLIMDEPDLRVEELQKLEAANTVRQSNGVFFPAKSYEELKKEQELEAYKKIWEEEYKQGLKVLELKQAQEDIQDLIQLSEDKAQVLGVKERGLQEKRAMIQYKIQNELRNIQRPQEELRITSPSFIPNADVAPAETAEEAAEVAEEIVEEEEAVQNTYEDEVGYYYDDYYNGDYYY